MFAFEIENFHIATMTQETKLSELHEVCAVGDADSLEEMLINGKFERLDYKDPDWGGRAPLHWCCIKGKLKTSISITRLTTRLDIITV